jgi:hypothetical protein
MAAFSSPSKSDDGRPVSTGGTGKLPTIEVSADQALSWLVRPRLTRSSSSAAASPSRPGRAVADRLQATHGCSDFAGEFIDDPRCGFGQFLARRGPGYEPDLTVLLIRHGDPLNPL